MENKTYNVGDWVLTKKGAIFKIIDHNMINIYYEDIDRIAIIDEIKTAIKAGLFSEEYINTNAYDILDKRMYIFVPYNISEIQKGIQAGHAVEQYVRYFRDTLEYNDYLENHKTWIILNGGTTNAIKVDGESTGSLNKIVDGLVENGINFGFFNEPDLNMALTAVSFLCDERVFDFENYPYRNDWANGQESIDSVYVKSFEELDEEYTKFVGGVKNVFLKELIFKKRLA